MTLSETWFIEGYIDFELQKYRLLAYLKEVKAAFGLTKLYPQLAEIVAHYKNLLAFRENKKVIQEQFPQRLDRVNVQKLELVYEKMLTDGDLMQELEHITEFALTQMKQTIEKGAEIFEFVEQTMEVEPVGIVPLYKDEGYVFLHCGNVNDVLIYSYTITLFEHKNARFKGIKLGYMDTRTKNLANTYQQIKLDVIRDYRLLPNPAVYRVEFPFAVPLDETLIPIAKRVLVRHIGLA